MRRLNDDNDLLAGVDHNNNTPSAGAAANNTLCKPKELPQRRTSKRPQKPTSNFSTDPSNPKDTVTTQVRQRQTKDNETTKTTLSPPQKSSPVSRPLSLVRRKP